MGRRFGLVLWRHRLVRNLAPDSLPQFQVSILEHRIEMIDADSRRAFLLVVTPLAVPLQEWLHLELERPGDRLFVVRSMHHRGRGEEEDGGRQEQPEEDS